MSLLVALVGNDKDEEEWKLTRPTALFPFLDGKSTDAFIDSANGEWRLQLTNIEDTLRVLNRRKKQTVLHGQKT